MEDGSRPGSGARTWWRRGASLRRIRRLVACAGLLAVLVAATAPAASNSVVVQFQVLGSTSLDASGCAAGSASVTFGSVPAGTPSRTAADCVLVFGSTNDTSALRIRQGDGLGRAMWMASDGRLDTSFDGPSGTGDGRFLVPGANNQYLRASVMQADGKLVAVGQCGTAPNLDICVMRFDTDGTLDATFDGPSGTGNGIVTFDHAGNNDDAWSVAMQPDGKIVVGGSCLGASYEFCVIRLLAADGDLDPTFDGESGTDDGFSVLAMGPASDYLRPLVVQPDGRIVVAGNCSFANQDVCVARLLEDGSFDDSFGSAGISTRAIGSADDYARGMVVADDGTITTTGHCTVAGNNDVCLARFLPDGTPDPTFDGPSGTGNGSFVVPLGSGSDVPRAIALQDDGKVVVAGECSNGTNNDMCTARFLDTGAWDTTWDGPSGSGNGWFGLDVSGDIEFARAITIQPDGDVLVTGECYLGTARDACVARLDPTDGDLDPAFDGPSGTGDGVFLLPIGAASDYPGSIVMREDGRILVVGYCWNGSDYDGCLATLDNAADIPDYVSGVADFGTSSGAFGACLHATASASPAWTVDATCAAADTSTWNPIGAAAANVATAASGVSSAQASIVFGVRPAPGQPIGRYVAPTTFEVVAPG